MSILTRLFRSRKPDPYWDRFIEGPLDDPDNDLTTSIRGAPTGAVFPVKSEVPEPPRMAKDLGQLAQFLGATLLGVARTDPSDLRGDDDRSTGEIAERYPYAVVCGVRAEYDPNVAMGIGGQRARHESASVNFSLAAYIRELGYEATVYQVDSGSVSASAGLGPSSAKLFVGDAILTDLPLALGLATE